MADSRAQHAGNPIASIDGLGPRGRGYHTRDEHIEVASLLPKSQALALLLLGMTEP